MKPSERRALEAEKKAQREAEAKEKAILKGESASGYTNNGDVPTREGFFSKNVRIITFAICAVLILTVLGPWSLDRLVENHRESIFGSSKTNKENITVSDIIHLAEQGDALIWSDFDKFNYTDFSYDYRDESTNKKKTEYIREYSVDGVLTLKVVGSSMKGSPACVQLIYYREGAIIEDIRGSDVRSFLAEYGYLK